MAEVLPPDWNEVHGWDFWGDYHSGKWEAETHATIDEFVTADSTYLDIGAWIGPTVKWAAPHAARVVAVEPDPVAFDCLQENTAEFSTVDLVRGAVADHSGTVVLRPHTTGFGSSMSRMSAGGLLGGTWQEFGTVEVPCWTLPDLWKIQGITNCSLVKMDIEGGESEVLDQVAPFLAALRVPFLLSMHEAWWSRPVDRAWFNGFSELRGTWGGFSPILCLP